MLSNKPSFRLPAASNTVSDESLKDAQKDFVNIMHDLLAEHKLQRDKMVVGDSHYIVDPRHRFRCTGMVAWSYVPEAEC